MEQTQKRKMEIFKTGLKSEMVDNTSYGKAEQIDCQKSIEYSS